MLVLLVPSCGKVLQHDCAEGNNVPHRRDCHQLVKILLHITGCLLVLYPEATVRMGSQPSKILYKFLNRLLPCFTQRREGKSQGTRD